jgi:hypothetical protein
MRLILLTEEKPTLQALEGFHHYIAFFPNAPLVAEAKQKISSIQESLRISASIVSEEGRNPAILSHAIFLSLFFHYSFTRYGRHGLLGVETPADPQALRDESVSLFPSKAARRGSHQPKKPGYGIRERAPTSLIMTFQ